MAIGEIHVKNISKSFPVNGKNTTVLDDISLELHPKEITVILGKSGCGKTTLLRIIGGLEKADAGQIEYEGDSRMAFVFQEPRLMPWLSVYDNIKFSGKKIGITDNEIRNLINIVGLRGFDNSYPNQLSGGMQHRVSIARAMAYKPSFIMMDEPFAALDYFTREQMQNELREMQHKQHMSILFVTHSIDEALLLGNNIVLIENGRIKKSFNIPESDSVRDLMNPSMIAIKQQILEQFKNTITFSKEEKNVKENNYDNACSKPCRKPFSWLRK